jgi:membrane-bound lytic murein transglycosylase D
MMHISGFLKVLLLMTVGMFSYSHAYSIEQKYPNYRYVFNEFDIDESYIYDEAFITFVKKHKKGLRAFYKRSLKRGKSILPMMKNRLLEDGVSDLFIYLSMVESGFITDAVSPKKAVGLWQFMPATAKHYDLSVDYLYDERRNAVRATQAAIKYLNKLHKQFGKWYLAAMAYNCGEGCVSRAIKRAKTDNLSILTNNHLKYLPKETREYMKKILLVAMIGEKSNSANDFKDFGIKNNEEVIEVDLPSGSSLKNLAKLIKIKYTQLKKLNPQIKKSQLPHKKAVYKIYIPLDKVYDFYLRYDQEKVEISPKNHLLSYQVKMNDSLESIAKHYQSDVSSIMYTNHLDDDVLELDKLLVIPVTKRVFEDSLTEAKKR